jgi:adenylate cyclase
MSDIFISYSSKDRAQADQLTGLLRSAGLSVWIDQQGIDIASSWSKEIVQAINECTAFVVLLSPASLDSHNVVKEVSLASEKRKRILPLDLEPVVLTEELEYALAGLQRSPMTNIDGIIRALGKLGLEATSAPIAPKMSKETDARKSVMVLPFEDISPTGDNGWFTDGMASELVNSLSKITALRVTDWNTSKLFKERKIKTTELARELDVRYFIEGQVRKFGDQIKISIVLLDIELGDHLWQDSLKGTMEDVFEIQEEVAVRVLEGPKLHLKPAEQNKLISRGTENAEAYELYLKAADYYGRQTQEGFRFAIQMLTEASKRDPAYANALQLRADSLCKLFLYYDKDPALLVEAEHLANKAISIKPDHWASYGALSDLYRLQNNRPQAEWAAKQYAENAPDSHASHLLLGFHYIETNQMELAVGALKRSLEIEPKQRTAHWNIIMAYEALGNREQVTKWARSALPLFEQHVRLTPDQTNMIVMLATVMFDAGEPQRSLAVIRPYLDRDDLDGRTWYDLACLLARLGEPDVAIKALNRGLDAGYVRQDAARNDPDLITLHGRPDFEEILQRLGATA